MSVHIFDFTNCCFFLSKSISTVVGNQNYVGIIAGSELVRDLNNDAQYNDGELAGDKNGNGLTDADEIAGDANGNGVLYDYEADN